MLQFYFSLFFFSIYTLTKSIPLHAAHKYTTTEKNRIVYTGLSLFFECWIIFRCMGRKVDDQISETCYFMQFAQRRWCSLCIHIYNCDLENSHAHSKAFTQDIYISHSMLFIVPMDLKNHYDNHSARIYTYRSQNIKEHINASMSDCPTVYV